MKRKTEISVIAAKNLGSKYDEASKETLKRPELIAPILRAVVPEYKDCTCEEIIGYIVKDSINDDPVDDVSTVANMLPTEMSSVSDKLIRYDTRFKIINPKLSDKSISVHLHIDLEVQNDYKPGYPIIKRGIYYGAREISSQLGILTENTNYDDIEKVYSIWICNDNVPEELNNTVSSYKMTKTDEIGITIEDESDYDLLNVIIVRRGNDSGTEEIFDYLTAYFNGDIEGICRHVDIRDNEEVVKGVRKMTGLGQAIADKSYEMGLQSGLQKGIQRGIQRGIKKGIYKTLTDLVRDGVLKIADAAERANMSEEEFSKLLKEIE